MKGYIFLALFSVAVLLLVPLCALGQGAPSAETPAPTLPSAKEEPCFKVKNTATGEVLTFTETDFIIGVVSCEMAPSSPTEALKAQAVAAYTYYCKQRDAADDGIFSNVPETLFTKGTEVGMRERFGDQYDKWYGVLKEVADAVKGERILYDGAPITACYHAISAGLTENAADVWGGDYPYLTPVDSAGDLTAEGYSSTVTIQSADLSAKLKTANDAFTSTDTPENWFSDMVTTDSGYVKSVSVCGTAFSGPALRTTLGLRSPCFTVSFKDGTYTFTVRGYGHNVGMSQAGAKYMALQGASYREILAHYYPHTVIE